MDPNAVAVCLPELPARVAIILVNWNGWRDTIACIESCLALDHPAFRILVCDNGSTDGSVEAIAAWARGETEATRDPSSPVTPLAPRLPTSVAVLNRAAAESGDDGDGAELLIVPTGGNLGFAGGNNVGLRWAMAQECGFAWLLNNDTVVPPDALRKLIAKSTTDPTIGLCGSTMVKYADPTELQGYAAATDLRNFRSRHLGAGLPTTTLDRARRIDPVRPHETLYPIGASILVTAAFLAEVGLMEESYFLYYEEVDWVLRGRPRFRVGIASDSIVYHKVGASAGSTPQGVSARSMQFLYRSRLRAARRFAPSQVPWVVLGIIEEAGRALLRGRHGRFIGGARALTGRVRIAGTSVGADA